MTIVPMEAAHVAEVAALERECFSTPWSERSIASELTNPLSLWLVALDGGRVAGYIGSQAVGDEADVMNVAVDPAHRRQGIASALLRELIGRLSARGVRSLSLEVRASNGAAAALYEREGFWEAGRRPNYYVNPREDARILRKEWEL